MLTTKAPIPVIDPRIEALPPHIRLSTHEAQMLLTRSPARCISSQADTQPPPPRDGSQDALQLPSRAGTTLHYRDGRSVTKP